VVGFLLLEGEPVKQDAVQGVDSFFWSKSAPRPGGNQQGKPPATVDTPEMYFFHSITGKEMQNPNWIGTARRCHQGFFVRRHGVTSPVVNTYEFGCCSIFITIATIK